MISSTTRSAHGTLGLDEVGRGCWAGPLVVAAVQLRRAIPGLRDSKKLSRSQREQLHALIRSQADAIGVGWVFPDEIDAVGLTQAVGLAMVRALAEAQALRPQHTYDSIVVDGTIDYVARAARQPQLCAAYPGLDLAGMSRLSQAVVRADDTVPAVSAASIVAKVARDTYMIELAGQFPRYGFERHVGYGTAVHRAALHAHGVTPHHRRSFAPVAATLERS